MRKLSSKELKNVFGGAFSAAGCEKLQAQLASATISGLGGAAMLSALESLIKKNCP
ncbi:hypothetical protein [Chryseobacterium sp. CH21]|uniref:hypothetical protein n=1 Tax=Chryseobacterium sp. CH21 TaxID=713556 RepID=UPI0013E9275D|nr:hypothetical protein [Chryseobacterium sp. CH21]